MPSSCDICWHQKCFSRSAEAMVLIIQLRSERRWVVNEKYTDSDLCKVSLQMTELTNSSQSAVKLETEREGLVAQDPLKGLNVLSVWILRLSCRMDADGVRKITVVANSCLSSRNHSCRGRKPQTWALPRQRGSWNKSKDYGLTSQRVWRNFYNG